jgi:hypothetical protein
MSEDLTGNRFILSKFTVADFKRSTISLSISGYPLETSGYITLSKRVKGFTDVSVVMAARRRQLVLNPMATPLPSLQ